MVSQNEALCFFLNQLGSRSSRGASARRPSGLKNVVRGNGEKPAEYAFPSLALFRMCPQVAGSSSLERPVRYDFSASTEQKSGATWPKETALRNLSAPVMYSSSELDRVPSEMAQRALDSFSFLVAANLKQFFRIQLQRHAIGSSGACALKARELASFFLDEKTGCGQDEQAGKRINVTGCSTSFHLDEGKSCGTGPSAGTQPITFHMDVDVRVLEGKMSIPVKTAGQVKASFERGTGRITGVKVTLDMNQLLLSMRTQARLIVPKAVAKKGFPVLHSDVDCPKLSKEAEQSNSHAEKAPETIPPAVLSEEGQRDSVTETDKMKKLALCASLELASVINDSSSLSMGTEGGSPQRKRSKRRLTVTMGGTGGALFAPPSKRTMIMVVGGKQVAPSSLGLALPSTANPLAHQA